MQRIEWIHPFSDRRMQKQGKSEDLPCRYIRLHDHAEDLLAEEIAERDQCGIPHGNACRRPADEPLDRHAEQSGRNGNNGADTRDHADDRQSAPMLCVDKFVAFTHERLKFLAPAEQLLHHRFAAPVAHGVDDQTAEHTGDHAQKNRQRQ